MLKRNVLFWGKCGLQMTVMQIAFMAGYGILFNVGKENFVSQFWNTAYLYGVIIGALFCMIGMMSYVPSYFSMVLSFGSSRKEAVLGAQIQAFAAIVSCYAVLVFFGYMANGKMIGWCNLALIELLVFLSGIGQFSSAVYFRYGKKGWIISIISFCVGLAACVIIAVFYLVSYLDNVLDWIEVNQSKFLIFLLAGIVVCMCIYFVSVKVMFRAVKKYEVKL